MRQLEVFFDYTCPFCVKGHENLLALLPAQPDIEVIWRPCEAHPRPEEHGPHSDLCIQAMFFAQAKGMDLWPVHRRLFDLACNQPVDIEDPAVLTAHLADLLDAPALLAALEDETYARQLDEANRYAYDQCGVWAVPSYRMNGRKLDAIEGAGVSREMLDQFFRRVV